MNKEQLSTEYFNWLCDQVGNSYSHSGYQYRKLLNTLFNVDFYFLLERDEDRCTDGINLRYKFGDENGIDMRMIAAFLDNHPCSILEMMIALSIKCEEHIMDDPDIGKRTGQWFWNMIINLGLEGMVDSNFNERYVLRIVDRFLNRKYESDGRGGLFYIDGCYYDMRRSEIWYQMMWYLDKYF